MYDLLEQYGNLVKKDVETLLYGNTITKYINEFLNYNDIKRAKKLSNLLGKKVLIKGTKEGAVIPQKYKAPHTVLLIELGIISGEYIYSTLNVEE